MEIIDNNKVGEAASGRPEPSEYGQYYGRYIQRVQTDDVVCALREQLAHSAALLRGVPEEAAGSPYAPGKWTLKELLGHVTDAERIFAYRALRFARNDNTELPGFEQDGYISAANFNKRGWPGLIAEFEAVRQASLLLFGSFDAETWNRHGIASQCRMSVRALAFCIAGHELHHMDFVRPAVGTASL